MAARAKAVVAAGVLTAEEVSKLVTRLDEPDFLGCGFVFIGAWGASNHRSVRLARPRPHPPGHSESAGHPSRMWVAQRCLLCGSRGLCSED
jgi:hypothetical protein